jgi:hypothetical protein
VSDSRHNWFTEFERDFRNECELLRQTRGATLEFRANEREWYAWAGWPHGGQGYTVTLPHNYALFRPLSVAVNTATKLFDMATADAPRRRLTPH